ncbi:hypothetical protein GCM10022243_42290 [Saccharothrix violaceirubra]|uniref:DUF3558 domain-containing protein n=1 Tax=Saccharothrix violaceirubra TaxID=413306 RepID=A0A7W7T2T1_9PSEU|nr:DUF3558 domain-containing protein [Saccharothrix violaceirubra]MBB4965518.1 hypothetical protein [Saccharothrix violaceirubra]
MTPPLRTVAALAVVLVLLACTKTEPGHPAAAPTTSRAPVPDLDIEKYLDAPCAILTREQQAELGTFRAVMPVRKPFGPSCEYLAPNTARDPSYDITFVGRGATIGEMFSRLKDAGMPVYQETWIAGRRAVVWDNVDGKSACVAGVATSEENGVSVVVTTASLVENRRGDPCETARRLAATVLANLER